MSTDEQLALHASTKMRPHLVARGGLPRGGGWRASRAPSLLRWQRCPGRWAQSALRWGRASLRYAATEEKHLESVTV